MTQHVIRLIKEDNKVIRVNPCGTVVRVVPKFKPAELGTVKGVPIISTSFQRDDGELSIVGLDVNNLDPETIYIVSTIAAQVIRKPNVVSPATIDEWVVRYTDDQAEASKSPFKIYWPGCRGQVFGVRALQTFF
jgi:hypothetical protein